jgi:hypothetical protein
MDTLETNEESAFTTEVPKPSGGAGPRPAAASQAACTGRAEGPPQRKALPHIPLEYVAGFETEF